MRAAHGKPINLGYINRDGQVWTDVANFNVSHALSHAYVTDLAAAWAGKVDTTSFGDNWHVRKDGKAPRAKAVDFDAWVGPIARFLQQVRMAAKESVA